LLNTPDWRQEISGLEEGWKFPLSVRILLRAGVILESQNLTSSELHKELKTNLRYAWFLGVHINDDMGTRKAFESRLQKIDDVAKRFNDAVNAANAVHAGP
jgi:hypothetical protein